ncbi:VOC family protein, partial [Mesorhizobium sp. M2D.F.Ca.ET.153.01.1.1]
MNVHRDFDHLWRDRCDTSSQRAPRVLIRVFVAPGELERSVA